MSSGISTEVPPSPVALRRAKPEADATYDSRGVRLPPDQSSGLQPWQFFVLAGLGCATALSILLRGQGPVAVVVGSLLIAGATLIGLAALRLLRPLVSAEEEKLSTVGARARAALEREKLMTLRTIKELEFDRAMGKLSDADFQEMSTRLRARAARLLRQLDAGAGYRAQIERDLAKRLGDVDARLKPRPPSDHVVPDREAFMEHEASAERHCASCSTVNDHDARFCKSCGAKLS